MLRSLEQQWRLIWIAADERAGTAALVARFLAGCRIDGRWYLGSGLTAATLTHLTRGLGPSEALIVYGCECLGPDSPVHRALADGEVHVPQGSSVYIIGRGEPPRVYEGALTSGAMTVWSGQDLQHALYKVPGTLDHADRQSEPRRPPTTARRISGCNSWAASVC